MVGILKRQIRQRRRLSISAGVIGDPQFVGEHRHGGVVAGRMMQDERHNVVVSAHADDPAAEHQVCGQVERPGGLDGQGGCKGLVPLRLCKS